MLRHIFSHELAQHLRSGLVLRPANLDELLPQLALHPYPKTNVFHGYRVYPMDTRMLSVNLGFIRTHTRTTLLDRC